MKKKVAYAVLDPQQMRKRFEERDAVISPFDVGIPLVELSDEVVQQIYYFRWHTYCKHLKRTPVGWVVTEFLPDVPWAGKYNTINCPAGHHFYEGRWLHDATYLKDYADFWFSSDGEPRKYSFWAADSIEAACKAWGDGRPAEMLLEALMENYTAWEKTKGTVDGMFRQIDNYDGMELSVGGSGIRPTINSYQYGDAMAIADIAARMGRKDVAKAYREKAEALRERINRVLWDADAEFYKTRGDDGQLVGVRELIGYVPWYFHVPAEDDRAVAWKYLQDERHFAAPYGPTTAERCHPDFMKPYTHECWWNGPSWPFATSQTLTALGNLLCDYRQDVMKKGDYFDLLHQYANSHYLTTETGRIPFIDENLDPFTGEWLARSILMKQPERSDVHRGKDYNHSAFCDHVISGLAGIRACHGDRLAVEPLFAVDQLEYFCADGILYHGRSLTVVWDRAGRRYGGGAGLRVLVEGRTVASAPELTRLEIDLSEKDER